MINFDRASLALKLKPLHPIHWTVFATCCAQRASSLYERYTRETGLGDSRLYEKALSLLWSDAEALTDSRSELSVLRNTLMKDIPHEESPGWTRWHGSAEIATYVLAYAIDCHSKHDLESALWAAGQNYEACDYLSHNRQGIAFVDPDAEARILQAPDLQAELQNQLDDAESLRLLNPRDAHWIPGVHVLKTRAHSHAIKLGEEAWPG